MTRSPLERRPMPERGMSDRPLAGSTHWAAPGLTWSVDRAKGKADIVTTRNASQCTPANSRSSLSRGSGCAGLTVVELVVVLFLVLLTIALAARFMGNWYDQYRFSGLVRSLTTSIETARAQAMAVRKFVKLDLVEADKIIGGADCSLRDDSWQAPAIVSPPTDYQYYKLAFLWSKKTNLDGQPYYVVEVRPSYAPSTVTSTIWFNARGYAVDTEKYEDPPGSGKWYYRQSGYASYQVKVKSTAVNQETSFTITPLGKIKQGDSS